MSRPADRIALVDPDRAPAQPIERGAHDREPTNHSESAAPATVRRLLGTLRRSVQDLLRVPRGEPALAAAAPDDGPAGTPAAHRVLVVEPDDGVRVALVAALSARGFAVSVAPDRERAVRRMSEDVDGFGLLLAGPGAARCEGDLLVRTVRRGGEADLAVVVVTGEIDPGPQLERAGADAVLDGSLGAELIARASEAVLARKRHLAPDQ